MSPPLKKGLERASFSPVCTHEHTPGHQPEKPFLGTGDLMAATQQLCSGSQGQEENYLNHNLLNLCSGENLVLLQGSAARLRCC